MSNFFNELKKRNVYKVATAYVVTGWLLLQIVDVVGPGLGWSESFTALLLKILVVGFPIALVLAWVYELTPIGFKRTGTYQEETIDNKKAGKRLNYFIIGVLSLAVCFLLVERVFFADQTSINKTNNASLAILPFTYISNDLEKAFLADGILTGVYDNLAQVNDLFISSTTSSFRYRDQSADLKKIAKDLNVNYILEGTIIYEGDRLKVSPRLIYASEDRTVWSGTFEEEYDQNTKGVFNIQKNISSQIANELKLNIPLGNSEISSPGTESIDAYELYLRAEEISKYRGTEDYKEAAELLIKALKIDPDFALAHAALILTYGRYGLQLGMSIEERERLMKPHMDRAMELAPQHGEVYRAKGFYEIEINRDQEAAIAAYKKAAKLIPNKAEVYRQLYWLNEGAERYKNLEKAYQLSPLEPMVAMQTAIYYCEVLDECEKSIPIMERARQADPDQKTGIGVLSLFWGIKPHGDLVKSFKISYETYKKHPLDWWNLPSLIYVTMHLDILPLAEKLVQLYQSKYPNTYATYELMFDLNVKKGRSQDNIDLTELWKQEKGLNKYRAALNTASTLTQLGRYEEALDTYQKHYPAVLEIDKFENKEEVTMGNADAEGILEWFVIDYVMLLRKMNEHSLADRYAKVLCELAENRVENDAFLRRDSRYRLQEHCLLAKGDTLGLIDLLDKRFFEEKDRRLIDINSSLYDHLNQVPEFQELKNRISRYITQSRQEVIAYLKEEGDWDPAWDEELE